MAASTDSKMDKCKTETKPFSFVCLRRANESSLKQSIDKYVVSRKPSRTIKVDKLKSDSEDGIIKVNKPWWTEFSELEPKINKFSTKSHKTATRSTKNTIDENNHESWFRGNMMETTGMSWLAGPSSSSSTSDNTSKVEDINVPSIYDTPKQAPKGRRALKRERKAEREKTLGKKWFGMKAPDVDSKLRNDMEMIRMRGVLDPKRFYKHQDRKALPKYFQMGTVVDEGTDFYSSRLTKKQRKQTLVEELMADANVRQYNKRKYSELQQKMRGKKKFKTKK